MGLRELAGHLAAAAPDWAHTAWRVVAPGAAVMAALLGWRYIAAVAMLVLPLTLAAAAGLEMRNKSWPMMTACAAAGVLGSLAPVAPLLGAGLLQQLLGVGLLAFLVGAMMHSRHCDCLLSRIMRRRLVQAAVTCAAGALFVSGLRRSLRLRLAARLGLAHIALGLFQALRVVHWWGVRWEILPEWPLGPIGVEPPSFRPLWAVATGSADGSGVGHVGMGAGGVDEIIAAVVAEAEAAERPPPGHLSMLLLAARCLLTPILFMWTSVLVEGYRGSLTEGGAASLSAGLTRSTLATGSSQSYYGIGAPFASPCRFDLDWVVLRGVVWVGVMCATGSWRIASGANVALHGAFSLLRLLAANSRLKQLFRNESSAAATAAILAAAAREQAAALTAASMAEAARRRQQAQASQALQAQRQRPSGQRSGAAAAAVNAGSGSSAGHRPRGSRRTAAQMIAGVAPAANASPVPTPAPLAAPAPPIAPTPAIPPPPAPIYSHVPRPRPAPPNKMLDRLREKYEVARQPVPPHRAGFANPGRGRGGGRGSAQLAAGGGALGAASDAGMQASAGVEREEEGRRLVRQVVQRVVARVTGATGPSAALGSPRAAAAISLPAAAPSAALVGAAAAAAATAAAAGVLAPGGQAMPATPAAAPQSWVEARPVEAQPQPQPQPQDRNQSHQPQAAGPQAPLPAQAWYDGALTPSEAEDYMRRQVAFLVKEIFFRVNLRAGPQEVQMTGDLARGACRTDSTEDRIRNSCSRSRDLQLHVLPRKSRDERPEEEGESARAQPVAATAAAAAAADSLVPDAAAAVGASAPAEPSAADRATAATAAAAAAAGSAAGGGVAADLGMASGAGAAAGASASPSAAAASAAAAGGPVVGDGPQLQPPGPQAAQCIVQGARREAEAAAAAAQDRPSGTHTLPPEPELAASRADGAEVNAAAEGEELQRCTLDSVRQARQRPEAATDAASSQRPPLAAAELVASPAGPAPPAAAAASAAASAVAAPGADDPRWADLWLQQQQQRRQQQQQQQQQQRTQQQLLPGEAGASPAAAGASGTQPTVAAARHVPSAAAGAASAGGAAGGATPAAPAASTPGLGLNLSGGPVFQAGVFQAGVGSGSGGGSAAPGTSAAGAGGAAAPAPSPRPRPSTRHAGGGSGNTTTGSTASTTGRRSAGTTSANASSNAGSGAAGRGSGGAAGTSATAAGTSGSGAASTTSGLARVSLMASSGPPRGGAFDDVLLAFSALVVVQWLALMPPWAQLLRLALWPLQGWMGPAGPMERALLWGSAVVLFGISVLVARVPTPRLQGLLRPCSGGSSGSGSVDVLALMRYNAGMYAVPLVLRLLRQVWAPLPWLYLAGLTNLELLLRAVVLGLQSVGFMRHLPLSGPPPLPLAGALLFRCDPPAWTRARAVSYSRLVSIEYGLVRPEVRASRRAAVAAGAIILGLDDAISEWLGMCVEGAAALMTAMYTIRSRAATAASSGAGDGAGGVAAAAAVAGAVSATVGSAGASRRTSGTGGVRVISTTGGSVRLGRAAPGGAAGPGGATVGVVGSGVAGLSAAETEAVVGAMLEQIRSRQSGGGGGGGAGGTLGASSSGAGAGGGAANGGAGAGGNAAGGGTLLRHVFPRNALDSDASERGARPAEGGEGDSDDDGDALKFYSDPDDDDDDEDGSVWEEDEDEDEDEDGEEGRRGARGEGVTLVAPWSAYPSQAAGLTRRRVRVRRSERTSG
ncbi:hypothetical protein CHLRE_17g718550v5 [Chlamydomonas reinhardtii]|uniref:Uncharacterized protein n=1 Tax=Chlamydomonas reinhardtii TaxID=3055 RepID=A0A2K3CQ48_CHLRE|nr:uncharacterized protein CHLRE_17g718550v5 [Chlamydomonas reinhardtii]PNW70409.1 hypothetical protein CHLRE_17g718550v5 [Chlamydomonas reinhardtii]